MLKCPLVSFKRFNHSKNSADESECQNNQPKESGDNVYIIYSFVLST